MSFAIVEVLPISSSQVHQLHTILHSLESFGFHAHPNIRWSIFDVCERDQQTMLNATEIHSGHLFSVWHSMHCICCQRLFRFGILSETLTKNAPWNNPTVQLLARRTDVCVIRHMYNTIVSSFYCSDADFSLEKMWSLFAVHTGLRSILIKIHSNSGTPTIIVIIINTTELSNHIWGHSFVCRNVCERFVEISMQTIADRHTAIERIQIQKRWNPLQAFSWNFSHTNLHPSLHKTKYLIMCVCVQIIGVHCLSVGCSPGFKVLSMMFLRQLKINSKLFNFWNLFPGNQSLQSLDSLIVPLTKTTHIQLPILASMEATMFNL